MGAVAAVMAGGALVSSMGGELPTYGPTDGERSRWVWGNGLSLAGATLTVLCSVLVVLFRTHVRLSLRAAVGAAIAVSLCAALLYVVAWGAFMAR